MRSAPAPNIPPLTIQADDPNVDELPVSSEAAPLPSSWWIAAAALIVGGVVGMAIDAARRVA